MTINFFYFLFCFRPFLAQLELLKKYVGLFCIPLALIVNSQWSVHLCTDPIHGLSGFQMMEICHSDRELIFLIL